MKRPRGNHPPSPGPRRRVYLASRFARRAELKAVAAQLTSHGFEVTSRWLDSPNPLSQHDLDAGAAAAFAEMDLEDLRRADLCIAFTESADHPSPGRGGRHAELGIALGLGLEVLLVGPREHVFHALPEIRQFANWDGPDGALAALADALPVAA